MNDIVFIEGQGGLGRPLDGKDYISGFLTYAATLPSGFSSGTRIKQFFSITEAETAGIAATGTFDVLHYHLSEYFRIQPKGQVYVGIYVAPSTFDFIEIATMQRFAAGAIKKMAVWVGAKDFASGDLATINGVVATLHTEHMPLSVAYGADISAVTDLSTLADLATLTNRYVSSCIGQDGEGVGAALYLAKGYSITCVGAMLGAMSKAKVHECIGWVEKFQMASSELDVIAFANGTLYRSLSGSAINALHAKKYVFLIKHFGVDGSYFNDSFSAIASTSDYATIENNQTIFKAEEQIRAQVIPKLNSPLKVNADGTLHLSTVGLFNSLVRRGLDNMVVNDELSAYDVIINPSQNVLATSKLIITVKMIPQGVARQIEFNIGYTVKL